MPYCTLVDLKNALPEDQLILLTDDTGQAGAVVVTSVVDAAIADADDVIDGYLRGRHSLPLAVTPRLIRRISVDLAIYNLYSRRPDVEPYELIKERKAAALKLLAAIQKGEVTLGLETGSAPPSPAEYKTNKGSNDRIFAKDVLDKY